MGQADIWTFTGEFRWLKENIDGLKWEALKEMAQGATPDRYAELRGIVFACDYILTSPDRYAAKMLKAESQGVENVA